MWNIKVKTDMRKELDKKINQSIKFLQITCKGKDVDLAYSGGKDSDVILELAKMAGINYHAIYKNTTIDPPHTIAHCKNKGVEIIPPKMTFAEILQKYGMPTRWARSCCKYLKEYKIGDYVITGVRRAESRKRAERYKEPTQCRLYPHGERVEIFMPLLEWTNEDVAEFIDKRGIKCHPLYYDEQGNFHVERRLGCLCCPMQSIKKRIEEFKKYPKMLGFYARNAKIFLGNNPDSKTAKIFRNEWEWLYYNIFLQSMTKFNAIMSPDLWGERFNCEKAIKEYFGL